MITVLLQQILDLLSAHFPGVITLLEKLNLIEPDVEEIRQDVEAIKNVSNDINANIQMVYIQSRYIKDNTDLIKADTSNISTKTDLISNNISTISTNTGRAASFAEDTANNTLDIDQKITSIASDTTQIRSDNQTLISNTNDIESYLLAMSYGLVKTTAANGNPVSFNTDLIEELPIVRAEISPIQAGSGTPAPDNVRALSGISSLDVVMNGETTTISLGGTVYGAELDIVNGKLSDNYGIITLNGSETWQNFSSGNGYSVEIAGMKDSSWAPGWSDVFPVDPELTDVYHIVLGARTTPNKRAYFAQVKNLPGVSDINTWKTWLSNNNVTIIYPKTPVVSSITPATFESTPGDNQISANSNADLTITYKESVANYIANNT